ncbi:MAG: helix-turn-helix domain-containing protein [Lachnospiraceae bacterium]|nr:helix-turn-helix domain-containing protein [Lachnospiraceae bacterium]
MENTSVTLTLAGEPVHISLIALLSSDRYTWRTRRHCNAEYELHIILSGSCVMEVEDKAYPLPSGTAVVVAPNCFHNARQVSTSFERLSISLTIGKDGHMADLLYRLSASPIFQLTETQLEVCRQLLREIDNTDLYQTELIHACLTTLIVTILRMVKRHPISDDLPWIRENYLPYNIIDMFFSSWPAPIGTEQDLARLLHLSRRQLNRILQQHYGMSFREKSIRARMDYAAWLLRTTHHRIDDISSMVNYTTESSFYSAFKKYFGMTPKKYRDLYSENK